MKVTIEMPNKEYEKYILWKNKTPIGYHLYKDWRGEHQIDFIDEPESISKVLEKVNSLEAELDRANKLNWDKSKQIDSLTNEVEKYKKHNETLMYNYIALQAFLDGPWYKRIFIKKV